ncbi:MAG: serine/threonine protein kinase [Streptosporangiales bacterium]|nr:serine/threonine protein kinase [Streptosporangiales bacterium]
MAVRRRRLDPVGPFGNPDGSRADLEDVISEFVDFGGNPAYGHLATRANDSKARVIVGKLGAGKTVYLRRLQDFQAHRESVYADLTQQSLPRTEVIVKACQWFSDRVLVEKWMQIWERAILRSLASHLLRNPELRPQLRDEEAEEIESFCPGLLDDVRRPRSIYGQVRDIITQRQTSHQLSAYLDDPLWDDLEDLLGEILRHCKPVYFYLDAVDEEFSHAPMYWLKCQEGLFHQVMRLLRDQKLGGRLHVVVCIRDIVMSSVYQSEHAPRYYNEPHIRILSWNRESLLYLLEHKLRRLPPSLVMRRPADGSPTVSHWLGLDPGCPAPDGYSSVEDYLLSHTRMIPRDVIALGNELNEEVLRAKQAGRDGLTAQALETVVRRCAKRFGDSQVAQCANQITSDLMPRNAALRDYSDLFTSTQAYIDGMQEEIRDFVRVVGASRFPRRDLSTLREMADLHFDKATDLTSVLWQNGLLGYVDGSGRRRFYSMSDVEQFRFPPDADTYVLHPCLAHAVEGIRQVKTDPPARSGRTRRRTLRIPAQRSVAAPDGEPGYAVGDVIDGRFEILEKIGEGGSSKVYRVRDDVENTERALKLFRDAAGYEAVRREISALRGIRHPHVMEVFWAGQSHAGDWYLISEFINGDSLEEFAGGKRSLRDREAADVALDLLDALEAFHPDGDGNGLIHRDIKPRNVVLTRTGAKLLDFNIASRAGDTVHTQSGTPPYQPPDADLARWDASTDLFAVGVVLYQLLCDGNHPYPNAMPAPGGPVIDPRTFRPDMGPDLAEFLMDACAPASGDRFTAAAGMRDALREIRAGL